MTEEETSWERPLIDKMLCSEADGEFLHFEDGRRRTGNNTRSVFC